MLIFMNNRLNKELIFFLLLQDYDGQLLGVLY